MINEKVLEGSLQSLIESSFNQTRSKKIRIQRGIEGIPPMCSKKNTKYLSNLFVESLFFFQEIEGYESVPTQICAQL